MTDYVGVIDVSEHQGNIDFSPFVRAGCSGVIIRACHAQTEDKRYRLYCNQARSMGLRTGAYQFHNPKRGSGRNHIDALGTLCNLYQHEIPPMLDIEWYSSQSPNIGTKLAAGPYAEWLLGYRQEARRLGPVLTYTANSYWGPDVPGAAKTAFSDTDVILARYPANTTSPPFACSDWPSFAFSHASGPTVPKPGWDRWNGWQFSSFGPGAKWGASSTGLDLNIVNAADFARWVQAPPTPEDPMPTAQEIAAAVWGYGLDPLGGTGGASAQTALQATRAASVAVQTVSIPNLSKTLVAAIDDCEAKIITAINAITPGSGGGLSPQQVTDIITAIINETRLSVQPGS